MNQGQIWDAGRYEKNARFVTDLGQPVVDLLAPKPGERILDLGCGDGVLTKKLTDLGCKMVGVDSSPAFIEAAQKLDVDARLMNGENLSFENEFDAVLSNAALHWMKHQVDVVKGVRRALKEGGRFAGECGGKGNVQIIVQSLSDALAARGIDAAPLNPWIFSSDTEYRSILESSGFQVKQIALHPRQTPLPGDVTGWLETFAGDFAAAIPEQERKVFIEDVRERAKPQMYDAAQNKWTAPYVRLRFLAIAV